MITNRLLTNLNDFVNMNKAEIIDLFHVIISPDQINQEIINCATEKLTNLYKKTETLGIVIDIYSECAEENIQLIAAIGIKQILSNNCVWNSIRRKNQSEIIKNLLIKILQNEKNLLLFRNIVESASPILKTDFKIWPDYLELIQSFSKSDEFFLFAVIMTNTIVKNMKESEFLESVWEFFTNLALKGISSDDDQLIKESSDLVSNLFEFVKLIDTNLPELFSSLFQIFSNLINQKSPICGSIIQNFEKISNMPNFFFPNSIEIAEQFLNLLNNSSNDIDLRCVMISPLISFLFSDPESNKKEILPPLFESIFTISSNSFIENEHINNQENMLICSDNIRILLEGPESEEICKLILEKGSGQNSKSEIITFALFLISIEQIFPELILNDISQILEFGFSCVETDDQPVKEIGFELFENLFNHQSEASLSEINDHFLEIINQSFTNNNLYLLTNILNSLNAFLNFNIIQKENLSNLYQSLRQVFIENCNHPDIQSQVVDCYTSLMKSFSNEISYYFDELFSLTTQIATKANDPEECKLKASAVKCLGKLIQYDKIENDEIINIIRIFFNCINSDDDILKSAGIQCFSDPFYTFLFKKYKKEMLYLKPFSNSEWFEKIFGFKETIDNVNDHIDIEETESGIVVCSCKIEKSFLAGKFYTKSFSILSSSIEEIISNRKIPPRKEGRFSILGQFDDCLNIFSIPEFNGATFQVETNFNCLNNICLNQTSEEGISYYIYNNIQGSQASVSTAASLIFRNYYLTLGSPVKINLIEKTSLQVKEGFSLINNVTFLNDDVELDFDYKDPDNYQVGVQENCQVILTRYDEKNLAILPYDQIIHQVFVSSLDFTNKEKNSIKQITKIEPFLLEAEYKSTILAAWENSLKYPDNPGSKKCFLTIIGHELRDVPINMIFDAIMSCQSLIIDSGLDVYLLPNDQYCFVQACKNLDQLVNQTSGNIIP